jgi:tetratricopeptide (TPR) repeat protein
MNRKIILSFAFCCLFSWAFSASALEAFAQKKNQTKQAARLIAEGETAARQRDFRAAVGKYAAAIALAPDSSAKAHFGKGDAHAQLNETDQAITELGAALAQGYAPLEVYKIRWLLYLQKKNYDAALNDAENAARSDPQNAGYNMAIGQVLLAKGEFQTALNAFEKFAQANPNDADVYYFIAAANANLGNTEKQLSAANEAINRNTKFLGESYVLIGDALRKNKKYQQAADFYRKATNANPKIYAAYHNLGDVYRTQNKFRQAVEAVKKGLLIFPDDENLSVDLGRYLILSNRYAEAIVAAQQSVKLFPNSYSGYANLCRALYEAKQLLPALEACGGALKINASDGEANVFAGFTNLSLNRNDAANAFFKRAANALLEYTRANTDYSDGFYLLGNAFYYAGQPQKAVEAYLRTLELNPNFAKARFNLGLAYFVKGDLPSARAQYAILLKTNKDLADKLKATINK